LKYDIPLYGRECTLGITLQGVNDNDIRLIVEDANNPETMFTNRTCNVNGTKTYYVRIPLAPDVASIQVYSDDGVDKGFDIADIQILPLKNDLKHAMFDQKHVRMFVNFAEEFSYNAGKLQTNKKYHSNDEMFTLLYVDQIIEGGRVEKTPARISQSTGLIEVSKSDFLRYTIPMRMAILLHEFAHFYMNDDMEDEIEADKHSLEIYMALGYPRIDAYNVFLDVFENSPSELNMDRYKALNQLFKTEYNG
tara:strand:- start:19 stop:768 length:750 start_codon:yes stop_codon:yes gene_type:complete